MELFVIIWQQKLCLFLICFLFMNVSICLLSLVDISCKYVYDYVSMMVKVCLFLVVTRLWLLSVFLYSRSSKVLMAVLGSSLLCYNKLDYSRKNLKLIDGVLQLSKDSSGWAIPVKHECFFLKLSYTCVHTSPL